MKDRYIAGGDDSNPVRKQAVKDGMMTLKQDGIEKVFAGNLDLLQVRKVCVIVIQIRRTVCPFFVFEAFAA